MSSDELVLITGGTGALGVPLVEAFAGDGATVIVLARHPVHQAPSGVRLIGGDMTDRHALGVGDHAGDIRDRVTTIVHAAGLTRFDAPIEAARAVNVEGTRNVLSFADGCRKLKRICFVSTIYVAGRRTGAIAEADLDHDQGFVNAYEQSKYETEQMVRQAMPRLPIAVCRLSTAIGDSSTGALHRLGAIHHAIRLLYHSLLPMIPGRPDSPVDLIATDYAVDAIRHVAGRGFEAGRTIHICAGRETLTENELLDLAIEAFLRYRPAWRRRAIEKPAIVELATFELFRQSVEAVAGSTLRSALAVLAPFAPQLAYPKIFDDEHCRTLLASSGIVRPPIRDTLMNVVRHLIEHDWATGRGAGGGAAA